MNKYLLKLADLASQSTTETETRLDPVVETNALFSKVDAIPNVSGSTINTSDYAGKQATVESA